MGCTSSAHASSTFPLSGSSSFPLGGDITDEELYFDLARSTRFAQFEVRRLHAAFRDLAKAATARALEKAAATGARRVAEEEEEEREEVEEDVVESEDEWTTLLHVDPEDHNAFAAFVRALAESPERQERLQKQHPTLLPTFVDERAHVAALMDDAARVDYGWEEGSTVYLLSTRWWEAWASYVLWDDVDAELPVDASAPGPTALERRSSLQTLQRSESGRLIALRPIAIDNSALQDDKSDFQCVPESVWKVLHGWYGGGPTYARRLVHRTSESPVLVPFVADELDLELELHPPQYTVVLLGLDGEPMRDDPSTVATITASVLSPLETIVASACEALNEPDPQALRLWRVDSEEGWQRVESVEELQDGDMLLLEPQACGRSRDRIEYYLEEVLMPRYEKKRRTARRRLVPPRREVPKTLKNGDWPLTHRERVDVLDTAEKWIRAVVLSRSEDGSVAIHYINWSNRWDENITDMSRIAPLGSQSRVRVDAAAADHPSLRGVTGLFNLGNTCYMNAIIQCLSSTPIASPFFTSGRFRGDINTSNPLGKRGKLALKFADLLRDIWSEQHSAVSPRSLKRAISKFAPRFGGSNQHDAHELLAYLLDGLHEDLNRVKKKPATAPVEADDRPDHEVAREAWEVYLMRNRSIIVDLFMGQLKSLVICPNEDCGYRSLTFDPFMYLPVPLAIPTERTIVLTVVPGNGTGPVRYGVTVPKRGSMRTLRERTADLSGIDAAKVVLASVRQGRLNKTFGDGQRLSSLHAKDRLVVYEAAHHEVIDETPGKPLFLQVVHRQLEDREEEDVVAVSRRFGMPLVVAITTKMTNRQLYLLIGSLLRPLVPARFRESLVDEVPENLPFTLTRTDRNASSCATCPASEMCPGCPLPFDDDPCHLKGSMTITVLWSAAEQLVGALSQGLDSPLVMVHSSARSARDDENLTLYHCLDKFTSEERLGKNDTWYCSKCKKHQRASKRLELFSLPEILIVQLKRFQTQGGYRRSKITQFIDFPIRALDLTPYLSRASAGQEGMPLYDLFAVVEHHGGTSGGHYTATARHLDDQRWYAYNDSRVTLANVSRIRTSAAYVLFYRRRH